MATVAAVGINALLLRRTFAPLFEMLTTIRAVQVGVTDRRVPIDASAKDLPSRNEMGATSNPLAVLTPREREILQLVAEGNTSQAIARQLGISSKTVQTHREHIMEKLGLRDITQLVRYAMRYGVIS